MRRGELIDQSEEPRLFVNVRCIRTDGMDNSFLERGELLLLMCRHGRPGTLHNGVKELVARRQPLDLLLDLLDSRGEVVEPKLHSIAVPPSQGILKRGTTNAAYHGDRVQQANYKGFGQSPFLLGWLAQRSHVSSMEPHPM
ncbi:hypothetical protein EV643_1642 [Kribbella sp. VKM Ac-2527]|uniref:Uncharacterized protein n=1 Tax=Kribbella caucasensis TaxID=2512215 RepID=A0A4R6IWX1_9ACTN|nr:hypothetical protein EV643_1642 [Kribbella sp. VKM Ac-2527]